VTVRATIWLSLAAVGCLGAGMLTSPPVRAQDPHAGHVMPTPAAYTRSTQHYAIPPLTLLDADGRAVALGELLGADKPVMINFIFTSCSAICPVMAATFARVQQQLGVRRDRVRLVSVTIDPAYDTPERLREYAMRFHARPDWHFLTGEQDAIRRVQEAFDAYRGNKSNHVPLTILRAGRGESWVRVEGLASPDQLLRELERGGAT